MFSWSLKSTTIAHICSIHVRVMDYEIRTEDKGIICNMQVYFDKAP